MLRVMFLFVSLGLLICSLCLPLRGEAVPKTNERLLDDIKFLASDDLEGRGVGTQGINVAAEFIKTQFAKSGLAVDHVDGDAFQKFDITTGSKLVEPKSLQLIGPDGKTIELTIGNDAEVCSFGGSGNFEGDVVFCGYGIDATDDPHAEPSAGEKSDSLKYNDFAGIDVEGKVVIVMRRNPRQADPKSPLGAEHGVSRFADLKTKMNTLAAYKAAAVLFVNDPYSVKKSADGRRDNLAKVNERVTVAAEEFLATEPADADKSKAARNKLAEVVNQAKSLKQSAETANDDALMKFGYAGNGDTRFPPTFHIQIKTCNEMLAAVHTDLTKLEAEINSDMKPHSVAVSGWKAKGAATVEKVRSEVFNVIGVIDGDGPNADETIVVGAHYDHVGRGGANSLAPGSTEIHNGADDNASGATTLIELARRFGELAKTKKPGRRLVFIAFTGEELGLLGSARYVKYPVFPLDKTVAMLNMDMVGRLKEDKLIVYGTKTSSNWETELNQFNSTTQFKLVFKPEGFGPSDHSSFYAKKIPVLHFFTGEHSDYHRPSDDWDKINIDGMRRVADLMEQVIIATAEESTRPDYLEVKGVGGPTRGGSRPFVGTIPEFGNEEPGYAISGVSPGGPAEKAGLLGGDRIIQLGPHKVRNLDDYDGALRKFSAGDEVDFIVVRDKKEITLKVTMAPPR